MDADGSRQVEQTKVIGIVLFDRVEELDAVGPWEILASWTQEHPEDGYRVTTLSPVGGPVTGARGLGLSAEHSFATAPALDVVLHPGGPGTRMLARRREHLDWVRASAATASLMTSVCTGALVYAAAGLLRGRPATTHRASLDELSDLDPSIRVDGTARFVDDLDVITSAGVSAGIDLALHLVARLSFPDRSDEIARYVQYEPRAPV